MGSGHDHAAKSNLNERALWLALLPTAGFMVAEIVGGLLTGSLALISDAGHMATDVFGIGIAIVAIRIGRRPADGRRSFGYERIEVLATAFNALLLFGVGLYILVEAYRRLGEPSDIQSTPMLVVAIIGLGVNLFSMRILSRGKEDNMNMKGAYLEVWSDFLGSLGVILAALIIHFTGWVFVDSLVAVAIGLWVFPRTWTLLSDAVNLLLEGVPRGIDLNAVRDAMLAPSGVQDVRDLHIWALTNGRICLTAHVVASNTANKRDVFLANLRTELQQRFAIGHITIQHETSPCPDAAAGHRFL